MKISGKVLAACDKELLGKKFEEKGACLHVKESFYKGTLINEHTLKDLIQKMDNINLVGKKCVQTAEKLGFCGAQSIKDVPYLLIIKF